MGTDLEQILDASSTRIESAYDDAVADVIYDSAADATPEALRRVLNEV